MFKSLFSKYVSAFMLIIVLSFIIVVIITASVIGRHSASIKQQTMESSSQAVSAYLADRLEASGEDIAKLIAEDKADTERTLSLLLTSVDGVNLMLTSPDGTALLICGEEDGELDMESPIDSSVLTALKDKGEYMEVGEWTGRFKNVKALSARAIAGESGELFGYVFIYSRSVMMQGLMELTVRVVMGSIIWVLLAALIAVYFISERVIAPLRDISLAAKKFASGKFDTRVRVRGSDEVAELAIAFNNMAESLDNYDNMRNKFMSDVSHDLRSPMTSISGFIDGILDGVIPTEKHEYYLQMVSSEIKRLSRLVSSLLDLSRIQAGERKFTMSDFDICEMARQIVISFEQKINAKELQVEFDFEEDRLMANADSDAIYQVLYNLCDNGVKFAAEKGRFCVSVKRIKGRRLQVEVFNEGDGISPEDINYVFERFYKSDKSRGLNKSGAGLGLFISKTIMDAHEQRIWVESEHGKNCRFGFTLDAE